MQRNLLSLSYFFAAGLTLVAVGCDFEPDAEAPTVTTHQNALSEGEGEAPPPDPGAEAAKVAAKQAALLAAYPELAGQIGKSKSVPAAPPGEGYVAVAPSPQPGEGACRQDMPSTKPAEPPKAVASVPIQFKSTVPFRERVKRFKKSHFGPAVVDPSKVDAAPGKVSPTTGITYGPFKGQAPSAMPLP